MPDLTVNVAALTGAPPSTFTGLTYTLTGQPPASADATRIYASSPRTGTLDADGQTTITGVPESPTGTWLIFRIPALSLSWPFTMGASDATLAQRVTDFRLPDPVGPTPGPPGPVGPASTTPGPVGAQGAYDIDVWRVGANRPETPTGGRIDPIAGTVTPPAGWHIAPPDAQPGEHLWFARTHVNPANRLTVYTPSWTAPAQAGEQGPPGPEGPKGEKGNKGDEGPPGPATGEDPTARAGVDTNRQLIDTAQTQISGNTRAIADNTRIAGANVTAIGELGTRVTALEARPSGGGGDLSDYRTAADQDIIDGRATAGILLARQEARTADGKAVAAQQSAAEAAATATTARTNADTAINEARNAGMSAGAADTKAVAAQTAAAAALARTERFEAIDTWHGGSVAQTIRFLYQPLVAVSAGVTFTVAIAGVQLQATTTDQIDATGGVLSVAVGASNAGTISRSPARPLLAQLTTQEGDTLVALVSVSSIILTAPVSVGPSAGVTTVTLPADYQRYRTLEIASYETADQSLGEAAFATVLLAAQTAETELTIIGNPGAGGSALAMWNPATRVLTALQQRNAPHRLVYAELHN